MARPPLSSVLMVLAASLGCSRDLPSNWSSACPASIEAPPAATAPVTVALDGDPPLPGHGSEGWIGLDAKVGGDAHAHHKHGHHGAPAQTEEHHEE